MYLKSLTLRGFKSFASVTRFEFEPGITAIVGPNGSGKSNVVDALSWVLGEQGAKTLRGGKMQDVIFAGTADRPSLGRAQVTLTIDNTDGALPRQDKDVTVSRTLFRSGDSEYAINGLSCRLTDIQELLFDSGVGRHMHLLVGQGHLDRILQASAEDRRGFLEEAAGILKHRRRKEKTLRKLGAMQENLTRLTDLLAELGRQLAPLGKQAHAARRAQGVQSEIREIKARLRADELVHLRRTCEQNREQEHELRQHWESLEEQRASHDAQLARYQEDRAEALRQHTAVREVQHELATQHERLQSLAALAQQQLRVYELPAQAEAADPRDLEQQLAELRQQQESCQQDIVRRQEQVEHAFAARQDIERQAQDQQQRLADALRVYTDRRDELSRLAGKVGALRSQLQRAEEERNELRDEHRAGQEQLDEVDRELAQLQSRFAQTEAQEGSLDAAHEAAEQRCSDMKHRLSELNEARQKTEQERLKWQTRREALRLSVEQHHIAVEAFSAFSDGDTVAFADLMRVEPGYEAAIAAALGDLSEAAVVRGVPQVLRALAWAKAEARGKLGLILKQEDSQDGGGEDWLRVSEAWSLPPIDPGRLSPGRFALELVTAERSVLDVVGFLLESVVVVHGLRDAYDIVRAYPQIKAVTSEAEVVTRWTAFGGAPSAPSQWALHAEIEKAEDNERACDAQILRHVEEERDLTQQVEEAQGVLDAVRDRLAESDAALATLTERLGHLGDAGRKIRATRARHADREQGLNDLVIRSRNDLQEAETALRTIETAPLEAEPSTDLRDELTEAAARARAVEMEERLGLRRAEERFASLEEKVQAFERSVEQSLREHEAMRIREETHRFKREKVTSMLRAIELVQRYLDSSRALAQQTWTHYHERQGRLGKALAELRRRREHEVKVSTELGQKLQKHAMLCEQQGLQIEALEDRVREEFGWTGEYLIAEFGPDRPVPVNDQSLSDDKWAALRAPVDEQGKALGKPFVRKEQEQRLKQAERELAALGAINPLALEEYSALEERHNFLSRQLADLTASRRDLLSLAREVDDHMETVFHEAFTDTAAQFEQVFARLFPGGQGRLLLTDPHDMLGTGIEIEAKPAGKKVTRLSLLSGGERSLAALALLVATFRARPSPFYVMDEVEAALDETNLRRLLGIFEEMRETSQLLVITHQQRTMEIADALYGVSMRGDGVSAVLGQRLPVKSPVKGTVRPGAH